MAKLKYDIKEAASFIEYLSHGNIDLSDYAKDKLNKEVELSVNIHTHDKRYYVFEDKVSKLIRNGEYVSFENFQSKFDEFMKELDDIEEEQPEKEKVAPISGRTAWNKKK